MSEVAALVLAVVVPALVIGVSRGLSHDEQTPSLVPILAGVAVGLPVVLLRRRWPLPLLAVSVGGSVVLIAATGERTPLLVVVVILLFTVASTHERRVAFTAGAATAAVLFVTAAVWIDGAVLGPDGLASIAWSLLAVATGDAVRTRRAYVAAVEERARRAEETREEEARRQVVEERLRIARELHDVVAHRMAVVSVQAAAASQLISTDPTRAAESMEHVRASAAAVLTELGGLLHVLRDDADLAAPGGAGCDRIDGPKAGADRPSPPRRPTPAITDLSELDTLVSSFDAVGLRVTRHLSIDDDAALPEAVGLVVYRVIQEALTNAHRHGSGTATLDLSRTSNELRLTVTNPMPAPAPGRTGRSGIGAGLGLVGMRERVEAVGGWLRAGPEGGQGQQGCWTVDVGVPLLSAASGEGAP